MNKFTDRRKRVLRILQKNYNIGAVLITHPVDICYLTGVHEGITALLLSNKISVIFTSKMFETLIKHKLPECNVLVGLSPFTESSKILNRAAYRKALAFQGHKMTWQQYQQLRARTGRRKLLNTPDLISQMRAVKDKEEIALIQRCVHIAEQAFKELVGQGAKYLMARSEKIIAAELEYRMKILGADRQGFPLNGIIVASGPNTASCHHSPTDRKPRNGEPLLFDWGAEINGYRSDITRVVFMGKPEPELKKIFEIVLQANKAGIDKIKPGVKPSTVADAGWNLVKKAGYGTLIRHGLGHGIGLDIHELPGIGSGGSQPPSPNTPRLKKNMVVTVEPGIYLDGRGGIRIEDDVMVTADGHKVLTSLPKNIASAVLE